MTYQNKLRATEDNISFGECLVNIDTPMFGLFLHFDSESEMINFKNSVLWAFEKYTKNR